MEVYWDLLKISIIGLVIIGIIILALIKCYKRVYSVDEILVIKKFNGELKIAPQGAFVFPLINSFTRLNLVPKMITVYSGDLQKVVSRHDQEKNDIHNTFIQIGEGAYSVESIRLDLGVQFKIKVDIEKEAEVVKTVKMYGSMLSNANQLGKYLQGQLSEAVKTATRKHTFEELLKDRNKFKESVKESIGKELDGLVISDVSIVLVDHTPLEKLDPSNMLDNTGRRQIEEINATKDIERESIAQKKQTQVTEASVNGQKERIQLTKSLEQEKAITEREIKNTQAEELTKIKQKEASEELLRQQIKIETDKAVEIELQNKERAVETSKIDNEKALGISKEESRKEIDVKRLDADMAAEQRRVANETEIAKNEKLLISQRAENAEMQDTLTKKEESIKDTVAFKEAERKKSVRLTEAKAESEAQLIIRTTDAKAEKEAFDVTALRLKSEAEASFEVSKKAVEAGELEVALDIKRKSAPLKAEADARNENAKAILVEGEAEATVISKKGEAEANVISKKGEAEAENLNKIYKATNEAGDLTRKHELDKLEIEKSYHIKEVQIKANESIGIEDAKARSKALENANLNIYGDADILKSVLRANEDIEVKNLALKNDKSKEWTKDYLSGEKSIPDAIKDIINGNGEGKSPDDLVKFLLVNKFINTDSVEEMLKSFKK